ncbi:MAG: FkbM family methyltransferase [Snowella sp.]|nr:FkbM family methyltransferase [Snowella sp.]
MLDLGGHLGQFSQMLISYFNCVCYCIEASPSLYDRIPSNIPQLKKFNYVISDSSGILEFALTENPEGNHIKKVEDHNNTEEIINTVQVNSITISEFLKKHNINKIDLLKLDIEGAEFEVLNSIDDSLLLTIKQITIEFHDFKFKDLKPQVKDVKQRLESLGFVCIIFSITTNGDVLFINKNLVKISDYNIFYTRYIGKFIEGAKRRYTRLITSKE